MFRTWKKVKIGCMSPREYAESLTSKGVYVSPEAESMLTKLSLGEPRTVALVRVTNTQLGLGGTELVRREDVYARAAELGLQRCPAEVGPALRGQVLRQPKGLILLVGMEPVLFPAHESISPILNEFRIFCLENSGKIGPALYAPDAMPGARWAVPHSWVFQKVVI